MNQLNTAAITVYEGDDLNESVNLRHYFNVVNQSKWAIAGLAFAITLLSILVVLNLVPVYRATSTLLIENQSSKVVSIDEIYGLDTGQRNYYQTQVNILKSHRMAELVIRDTKIDFEVHPTFNPNLTKQETTFLNSALPSLFPTQKPLPADVLERHMIKVFKQNLTVTPLRGTDLIYIMFDSPDPKLAAEVANLAGEVYIESQLEARLQLTQKASSWLTDRLETLRDKLTSSEAALQAFQEQERLVESGESGVRGLSLNELNQISSDLAAARNDRIEKERTYNQVRNLQGASRDALMTHPNIVTSPGVVTSKETMDVVDRKVLELSERYGVKHPKMIAAKAEQNAAKQQLFRQIDSAVGRLKELYDSAVATEANLVRNEQRSRGDIQDLRRKEFKFAELQRSVETDRQLYDTFFTRFRETDATEGLQAANARISDPAIVPEFALKPKKRQIVTIVLVLAIMFGVGLAFLRDYLDNTVKSGHEVESKLGLPLLGQLPLIKGANKGKDKVKGKIRHSQQFLDKDQLSFAEAVRTLRTGVLLSSLDKPHKTVLITSSIPGEGKTTVSYNLAIAMGQMEKVLLIDADMRRPSVAIDSGLTNQHPGLSNLVAGTSSLEECVHTMAEYGIDVIPAGMIPPNPLELLSSNKFHETLNQLGEHYDRIVIDSAPCQAVSDSLVISTHVDAMMYVVQADSTSVQLISGALQRLQRVGAPLIGVVLNQFDVETASKYSSYSAGYYDYYGTEEAQRG